MRDAEALERIRTVVEDLDYLRREWDQDVEDASLRRSSAILRQLLVDGLLHRAWKDLGLQGHIIVRSAPSLELRLKGIPTQKVVYAQAGGALYRGMRFFNSVRANGRLSDEQCMRLSSSPEQFLADSSLKRFTESLALVIKGTGISRLVLVQYIANKRGGVHLDSARNMSKEKDKKFKLLDELEEDENRVEFMGKWAVYYELLSLGQAIVDSPDVLRFIEEGAKTFGARSC